MTNQSPISPAPAGLAPLFEPPYFAVMFTSQRTAGDAGYDAMADKMVALAADQPGYLGAESVRDATGLGITMSYWRSEADIAAWRRHGEHQLARDHGRQAWYSHYSVRIAKVERAYGWCAADGSADPANRPANPLATVQENSQTNGEVQP
ncbi:MAG: antibiotic biosynthesis monooxygenase [Burkholderiaceae bacterium]|nr:antibiotic biosynthesis monooxygenase [Burkholderiaceae bacterium]